MSGCAEAFLETQTPEPSPDSLIQGLGSCVFHIISNFCEWDPQEKTHFAMATQHSHMSIYKYLEQKLHETAPTLTSCKKQILSTPFHLK